jgi:hypothetical protein
MCKRDKSCSLYVLPFASLLLTLLVTLSCVLQGSRLVYSINLTAQTISNFAGDFWYQDRPTYSTPPPGGGPAINWAYGDGRDALVATLNSPWGIAIDDAGFIYIADSGDNLVSSYPRDRMLELMSRYHAYEGSMLFAQIRVVDPSGIIWTVAGTQAAASRAGDGGAAKDASILGPHGIAFDAFGNLVIAEAAAAIRMIEYGTLPKCPAGFTCECALRPVGCDAASFYCPQGTSTPQPVALGFKTLGFWSPMQPTSRVFSAAVRQIGSFTPLV